MRCVIAILERKPFAELVDEDAFRFEDNRYRAERLKLANKLNRVLWTEEKYTLELLQQITALLPGG